MMTVFVAENSQRTLASFWTPALRSQSKKPALLFQKLEYHTHIFTYLYYIFTLLIVKVVGLVGNSYFYVTQRKRKRDYIAK